MRQARLDKQKTKEIQTRKQKINNFSVYFAHNSDFPGFQTTNPNPV